MELWTIIAQWMVHFDSLEIFIWDHTDDLRMYQLKWSNKWYIMTFLSHLTKLYWGLLSVIIYNY